MSLLQKQKQLLIACVATAITVSGAMYVVLAPSKKTTTQAVTIDKEAITTPHATVQSNELWMQQISQEAGLQGQKIVALENIAKAQFSKTPHENDAIKKLEEEVEALKQTLNKKEKGPSSTESSDEFIEGELHTETKTRAAPAFTKHTLNLQGNFYKVGSRIPPGSYVKAVLLSAVDVGVGVNTSTDPQPVVMRLLGEGCLPNDASSPMKRCHVVGAAVGDLSSERAYIRLEKMSCVNTKTGHIVETDVAGYVSGEDGKNGLQGVVVDRSGRMISSAMLVGLISGVSSVAQSMASAKASDNMVSKLGERGIQNNMLSSDFIKGGTQGVSGAFDKLADYYIKRAEQLQPVIQINPGRVVTIIFSKGATHGAGSSFTNTQANSQGAPA